MELTDFLSPEAIIPKLKVESKKQLLQVVAEKASILIELPQRDIFDVLLEREKLGSTVVGDRIALPHGKLKQSDKLFGMFVRLEKTIEFDTLEKLPVDLVFVLLVPDNSGNEHLLALSHISSLLRNTEIAKKLRDTENQMELFRILTAKDES